MSLHSQGGAAASTPVFRLPSPPVLVLAVLHVAAAGMLAWQGEGAMRWSAVVMLLAGLVTFAWLSLARRPGGGRRQHFAELLQTMNAEQADLSVELPEAGDRESRETARLFNAFLARLRAALEELQQQSIRVSLTSSHGRKITTDASRNATRQAEYSELIFRSSDETATAVGELSQRTNNIAETNSRNLEVARSSLAELQEVTGHVEAVTGMLQSFHGTVGRLETTSENIASILSTVQGFAAQTNMLALNAAIEAARAGEQGRGFAVVADEVRGLAEKVHSAAEQISSLVEDMGDAVSRTAEGTEGMIGRAEQARAAVETTAGRFDGMVTDFAATHDDLLLVSSAIEQLSVTNREVHGRSTEIRDLGLQICSDMEASDQQSEKLRASADLSLEKICQFRIGQGRLEGLLEIVEGRRDQLQRAIERLVDEGVDMFDRNYKPVPGTEPQKYEVSYAKPFQQACQDLVEGWRGEIPDSPFCLPLDSKGFVVIHYREVSQPPTGDPKVDLLKSRNMRFFDQRDINFTTRFRLQSYLRDTGEVMFNLTVPVTVKGKRWGGVFMGLKPEALGITEGS